LANNSNTRDVANIAMLGTPDGDDDPLASPNDSCSAAKDFVINAPATHIPPKFSHQLLHFTGNWNPLRFRLSSAMVSRIRDEVRNFPWLRKCMGLKRSL
jgi:hypothetical protein